MADFTVRTMKKSAVFLNETKLRGRSERNASFVVPSSVIECNETVSRSTNDEGLCCKAQDDTSAVIPDLIGDPGFVPGVSAQIEARGGATTREKPPSGSGMTRCRHLTFLSVSLYSYFPSHS